MKKKSKGERLGWQKATEAKIEVKINFTEIKGHKVYSQKRKGYKYLIP